MPETLTQKFLDVCREYGARESLRVRTPQGAWQSYSYEAVLKEAQGVASWLQVQGFKKKDRAAVILDNGPSWAAVYFGILLAGGIAVPLDPQAPFKDNRIFLEDAGAALMFVSEIFAGAVPLDASWRVKMVVVTETERIQGNFQNKPIIFSRLESQNVFSSVSLSGADTASIIYTSGTTSQPKGVELTHANFLANWESIDALGLIGPYDRFLSLLPLFHAYAFMGTLLLPFFNGALIVYPKTIKSAEVLEAMQQTAITIFVGVPALFLNMMRTIEEHIQKMAFPVRAGLGVVTALGRFLEKKAGMNINKVLYRKVHQRFGGALRYFVSGGARLEPAVFEAFRSWGFSMLEGYGLTETAPIVTLNPPGRAKAGSVGCPVKGVAVKIVHPDASGVGEIVIRGANVMKGYYQKPQETQEVIKEGWFHSGDLGVVDSEGYVFIRGRLKEMIVLDSGKNIFPEEIEKHYSACAAVKEVGVFLSLLTAPAELKAVVVPDLDFFKQKGQMNIEERIRWDFENISRGLAAYKRIRGFVLSKEPLPRTRLGKVKRYVLSDIYARGVRVQALKAGDAEDASAGQNPLALKVMAVIRNFVAQDRPIALSSHLELDLGMDSLTRVEMIAALEKTFQTRVDDRVLADIETVGDLIEKAQSWLAEQMLHQDLPGHQEISWKDLLVMPQERAVYADLDLNPSGFSRCLIRAVQCFLRCVLGLFCRFRVIGREKFPQRGPFFMCCNHSSYLDAFVVTASLPPQLLAETYFIGLKEIFHHPAVRWLLKRGHLIAIDPSTDMLRAMRTAAFLVNQGKVVCIFPEGSRSIDGEVKKFKNGLGILAAELKMAVLPLAIEGTFGVWPRTQKFPRPHPVALAVGKLISSSDLLPHEENRSRQAVYAAVTQKLQEQVSALKKTIPPLA